VPTRASIVIRTLDEARHLPALLEAIEEQDADGLETEVVVVDSGSRDGTLEIAEAWGCRVAHIDRHEFSFGRSLNRGCEAATGELLVFVSGHCVPVDARWLRELVAPLLDERCGYVYGRQVGPDQGRFSERQHLARQFPPSTRVPQEGFFCNNANAALLRETWAKRRFDEELTGLEDMALARALVEEGRPVGYVAEACVVHHHDETWRQIRWRFEREAVALQHVMPEVHVGWSDFLRFFGSAALLDLGAALQQRELLRRAGEILRFRFAQYWGTYRGNREHRELSRRRKELYFFPVES
jgi:rhamnosyltransferase